MRSSHRHWEPVSLIEWLATQMVSLTGHRTLSAGCPAVGAGQDGRDPSSESPSTYSPSLPSSTQRPGAFYTLGPHVSMGTSPLWSPNALRHSCGGEEVYDCIS